MFDNATNLISPKAWCAIPTNFGGGGGTCYVRFYGQTSLIPRWTVSGSQLQYSINNGANWYNFNSGDRLGSSDILIRGSGRTALFTSYTNSNAWVFEGTGSVYVTGNMNALLDYTNPPATLSRDCFAYMFYNCTTLYSFSAVLPANTLSYESYDRMFNGCTSLYTCNITLPTKNVTDSYHYYNMFSNCNKLVYGPKIMFINLNGSSNVMYEMFYGCTKLTTADRSNIYTTLSPSQTRMFRDCNALTTPLTYAQIPSGWK
jgi:hypothetical protein